MNANDIIEAIHAARYTGEKVGLQNTRALLDALNVPYTPVPAIHVAGTNGKGSVCAMVESILRHGGYRTGLYTSPFLQKYNERIRLNGVPITDDLLVTYGTLVLAAGEKLKSQGIHPTAFELGTALSFLTFFMEKVDIAVIEVGLGGRLDPTNVITPLVSVITAIGLDHTHILGDTLEKIAGEKACIIKHKVPAIVHPCAEEVAQVIQNKAKEMDAPCRLLSQGQIACLEADAYGACCQFKLDDAHEITLPIPLPGAHQQGNALTAFGAVDAVAGMGYPVPMEAIIQGMKAVHWPARLEWVNDHLLIDGAHNAQGARALENYMSTYWGDRKRVLLTGVLEEKLENNMLHSLCTLADQVVTITPDSPRAMTGEALAKMFEGAGKKVSFAPDLLSGYEMAKALAGNQGMVVVAGSLYLAGELRKTLGLPV